MSVCVGEENLLSIRTLNSCVLVRTLMVVQVNLLHDKEALEGVANAKHKDVPDVVHSYFGPYIGVYFAWLSYYTK